MLDVLVAAKRAQLARGVDLDAALEIAAAHGCHPLRGVATYEDIYKLTYVRGPSGIIFMLAEELTRTEAEPDPS